MGKYKGKNPQQADQSDSNQKVHRDSFFLKNKNNKGKTSFFSRPEKKHTDIDTPSGELPSTNLKEEKTKKPFDKRQWRIKKYSNKYKVEQWKEMRKRKVLNEYQKFTKKKDERGVDVQKIYEKYSELNSDSEETNPSRSLESGRDTSFDNAETNDGNIISQSKSPVKVGRKNRISMHDKMLQIKEEKLKRKEEILKKKAEREEALKLSKQKKAERFRRLNKKTKKGQPIMKDRMEMLYEQIQKICQEQ